MGKPSSRTKAQSSADRKFEKKLQFYTKVRDTITSLTAQKTITKKKKLRSRQKKLKVYSLSSLSEVLPEVEPTNTKKLVEFKLKGKTQKDLVLKEEKQLKIVINHPAFQSDPFGAIYQHLQNTQPEVEEKQKPKAIKGRKKKVKSGNRYSSKDYQPMEG